MAGPYNRHMLQKSKDVRQGRRERGRPNTHHEDPPRDYKHSESIQRWTDTSQSGDQSHHRRSISQSPRTDQHHSGSTEDSNGTSSNSTSRDKGEGVELSYWRKWHSDKNEGKTWLNYNTSRLKMTPPFIPFLKGTKQDATHLQPPTHHRMPAIHRRTSETFHQR